MCHDRPDSIADTVERIERDGVGALATRRLLALLGVQLDGPDCSTWGLLRAVLDDPEGLCLALSRGGRARVLAFRELHARCLSARLRGADALEHSAAMREFVRTRLHDVPGEVFAGVFLDRAFRLLAFEVLFSGPFDGSTVQARVVARRAVSRDAAALVAVHHRSSGYPQPSEHDQMLTRALAHALAMVDVGLVDHLLVGRGRGFSYAERGLL